MLENRLIGFELAFFFTNVVLDDASDVRKASEQMEIKFVKNSPCCSLVFKKKKNG